MLFLCERVVEGKSVVWQCRGNPKNVAALCSMSWRSFLRCQVVELLGDDIFDNVALAEPSGSVLLASKMVLEV